jgi:hypothetical protein
MRSKKTMNKGRISQWASTASPQRFSQSTPSQKMSTKHLENGRYERFHLRKDQDSDATPVPSKAMSVGSSAPSFGIESREGHAPGQKSGVRESEQIRRAQTTAAMRRRNIWLPSVLLFASVLLLGSLAYAIANFDRGAENLPSMEVPVHVGEGSLTFGPTGEQLRTIWQITIASIFLITVSGVVYSMLMGTKLRRLISIWELLGYAFGIGLFAIIILLWPSITSASGSLFPHEGVMQPPNPGNAAAPSPISTSGGFLIAALVFAAVLVAVFLFARFSRIPPRPVGLGHAGQRTRMRYEAASTLRRTFLDLEAGRDFRTTVLTCYQKMCAILSIRGVSHQEVLTPREIENHALSELGLSQKSIRDLTSLFEEARYSAHEIGQIQRDRAMECLTAISRELRGAK